MTYPIYQVGDRVRVRWGSVGGPLWDRETVVVEADQGLALSSMGSHGNPWYPRLKDPGGWGSDFFMPALYLTLLTDEHDDQLPLP